MGDDVSLPVHPFLFMAVDTRLCVGRRVAAGSFYFIAGGLIVKVSCCRESVSFRL